MSNCVLAREAFLNWAELALCAYCVYKLDIDHGALLLRLVSLVVVSTAVGKLRNLLEIAR